MPDAVIRPGTTSDVDAVPDIETRATALLDGHPAYDVFTASPTPPTMFDTCVRAGRLLVAEQDGVLVGYACWGVLGEEAHLLQMDVDPAYGRRGIGRRLLRQLCADVATDGFASIVLTTLADVPWNQPFYASEGFTVVAPRDYDEHLRAVLADEREAGFPMHLRVAMRKPLR